MARYYLMLCTMIMLAAFAHPALADGFMLPIIPSQPRFSVTYHRVNVTIDRQVATTEIDQAFHNNARQQVEGTYIFPLADGMSLSKFSMFVGGEELQHRILETVEARRIYSDIVAKQRDPALLEWLGSRMIKASVFPIQAGEDKRIRIAYQEVLTAQNGIIKYVYPLKTEKVSASPLQECSVNITIHSAQPIRNVYSPTHAITVTHDGEYSAHVSYSEKNVLPDQDLVLYYTVSEQNFGVNLLTYRDGLSGDGFFALMVSPKSTILQQDIQPKDVVFVLDTSGSMANDNKIKQAKDALRYCLHRLDTRDRFGLIIFSSSVNAWQTTLQQVTEARINEVSEFFRTTPASGGTDINSALQLALGIMASGKDQPARPKCLILLTDGQPTVGETNVEKILATVQAKNDTHAHVFDFGVGQDYNAHFLDKLANMTSGYADNVLPKEDIEVKVSSFYEKIATPLLMNLALDWGGMQVYDTYPPALPDLFQGSQLLITGRYRSKAGQSSTQLILAGEMAGRKRTFAYNVFFPELATADDFIPRLWATRKIGYLEDQVRLNGAKQELLEEIISLSKQYGVLTEYTSFLVDLDTTAPGRPMPNALSRSTHQLAKDASGNIEFFRAQTANASAVSQSVNRKSSINAMHAPSQYGNVIVNDAGAKVQLSQMQNISQRSFVQSGSNWVDVNYNNKQKVINVKAFSPAYFQLANAHPRMAQYMSVGVNVTVALQDTAIQVSNDGQSNEFSVSDMKSMSQQMNDAFGNPATMQAAMLPVTIFGHTRWTAALLFGILFAFSSSVIAWRRRRRQPQRHTPAGGPHV